MTTRRNVMAGGLALATTLLAPRAGHAQPLAGHHVRKVQDLLSRMTLDEKIGQMHQPPGGRQKALNSRIDAAALDLVRKGGVGSYLHVAGAQFLRDLQKVAVEESRLKIPLLFAIDVVHGYRTLYPVPLAMAATFDPDAYRACARMAAVETSVAGLHWTFAPMVDVARDPRWGRVVEGSGEDAYLGSVMSIAQTEGFQTKDLAGRDTVLACVKHFGAYGAVAGGRDYDSADISERTLHEVILPPFAAGKAAGAGSFMTAFNDIGGVPTTANAALVRGLLRDKWGFDGIVVSDWNAISELMAHGVAETLAQAAALALKAGVDMDMAGGVYAAHLKTAVAEDPGLLPLIDQAVTHILMTKARLGLFDDPYRFGDVAREKTVMVSAPHRAIARDAARKAVVLLKNDGDLLPLAKGAKVAVVGALADDARSAIGSWKARGEETDAVTLVSALKTRLPGVVYVPGAAPRTDDLSGVAAAVEAAKAADVTLLVVGEDFDHSAESRSRSDLSLPGGQKALADAILATGKPVVLLVMGGRPLAIPDLLAKAPAALMTWLLGVESGPALADILLGDVSPAGRLPMGLPRASGSLPETYAHYPTGRPADPDLAKDTVRYHDLDIGPVYPFGHGLSYARFAYSDLVLDKAALGAGETVSATVTVTNTGKVTADEVVQLYMRDPVAAVARPVKELRGFRRLTLKPGETRRLTFTLSARQCAFWDNGRWRIQKGRIDLMIGASSADIRHRVSFVIDAEGWSDTSPASIMTPISVS
ncbi:beta-glucosidase [Caulobacter vibrioides]|uniref:Beta-D-glucoside glucohydrolase n=1 Tax=Caulobacter vibrioides TaxID=155892 RepID=A0A290MYN0_CAUVI|nr:glycoside hydrolase family 3 N-terminal domain-containing protein [Caulobacter vibrioides]ATC32734.1 beta-glucosidase [Caulobacter vibrioides]